MGRYLKTKDIADRLGLKPASVAARRRTKQGPPWEKVGTRTVRYDEDKFKAWLAANPKGGGQCGSSLPSA